MGGRVDDALTSLPFGGSITRLWGVDYSFDVQHYRIVFTQGLEAIIDTTFLSAVATPVAGLMGMLVAFMTTRKTFSGKEALDFFSNLGGAVPGIILGIGYIVAFIQTPWWALFLVYAALAIYLSAAGAKNPLGRVVILAGGTALAYVLTLLPGEADTGALLDFISWRYLLVAVLLVVAGLAWWGTEKAKRRFVSVPVISMALFLVVYNLLIPQFQALHLWSRTLPGIQLTKVTTSFIDQIEVFLQPSADLIGLTYITISVFILSHIGQKVRLPLAVLLLGVGAGLLLVGQSFVLVGTPYIIIFAYAVRSLPASVRAGVAALQQVDPSVEEASASLGANAQYTFRRVTIPLILPAFIAGLVFSFARHMTSLSTIIFLVTGKWRILSLEILDSVERRGLSVAAAYSVVLITIVLLGIGLTYLVLGRTLGSSGERVDFNI